MLYSAIKTIERFRLVNKNDRIIIGLSGGADSVCLLLILNLLKRKYSLKIYAAHLDHSLRNNSPKDVLFVKRLCENKNIPLFVKELKKGALKKGDSLEQEARNARLKFFLTLSKKLKANKIALGHNFDDQSETVLMRIIRGSGLYGLSAIVPKRLMQNITVIRPLIETERKEIESFLTRKKQKFITDETNKKELYFRNKIRLKTFPYLEKLNPNIKQALNNLAENAYFDYQYLEEISKKVYLKTRKLFRSKKVSLKLIGLKNMHPALLRMSIRFAYKDLKNDTRKFNYQHFRELEDLIFYRPIGSVVNLPAGISVKKTLKTLDFAK